MMREQASLYKRELQAEIEKRQLLVRDASNLELEIKQLRRERDKVERFKNEVVRKVEESERRLEKANIET